MDKIEELLEKTGVDLILLYNAGESNVEQNFFYLTELFEGGIFEESYLIGTYDTTQILTSKLEEVSAKKSQYPVIIYQNSEDRAAKLKNLVNTAKTIGVNFEYLTVHAFKKLKEQLKDKEFIDISTTLKTMRMVKTEKELEYLRKAAKIASIAAEEVIVHIREGMNEYELAAELTYQMLKAGATDNAFAPIVAFGKNSAEPHYAPGAVTLKRGDFILMDFGARYHRYNSDITRTYVFGKATKEQKELYETVLQAQMIGLANARAGRSGKDIDSAVREYINSTKYKGLFIHSLGHGIGLTVHDHPGFSQYFELDTKENMVITIEPGIYIKDFGGVRIEDDVILKQDSCEVITTAPKYLIEL